MRSLDEEEPEVPDEPEDELEPKSASVPSVAEAERPFEYSVRSLAEAAVGDGTGLADRLNEASSEGWDLVSIVDVNGGKALVLRRRRRPEKRSRSVGFAPPGAG
ncbi:MAG: hypothetical protein ACREPI_10840 [Candidatus Dormibacterales bacterium]